jgi:predicted Na+-dependent transporter
MFSNKRRGRHSTFGTLYYWCLVLIVATATGLSVVRWAENYHLFILGTLSLIAATLARTALRRRWRNWVRLHITGMGLSYVLMLTAFYVDNGKNLPLWKELPQIAFWLLPGALGLPLIVRALLRHPLARRERRAEDLAKSGLPR